MNDLKTCVWMLILYTAMAVSCTFNNNDNKMKLINDYWQELTTAPDENRELDVLERLRVYLRDEHISYEVFGTSVSTKDSLVNLANAPVGYSPGVVTIKFYTDGDKVALEKRGWKPRNPGNAFYLFNE